MKIAIIADGHLFQTFMKNYDPVQDFDRVLNELKDQINPDVLLVAGDMFDYKKTQTAYLRHYEGEALMITIRNVLKRFGLPIYAIRGNHEKGEVLRGLDQTVDNFHYVKNEWKKFGGVSTYFMDTHYESGGLYDADSVAQILKKVLSLEKKSKTSETRILLSHETFAPFENSLPKQIIKNAKQVFGWIINGHMHFWSSSSYGLKDVVTLPSILPSRIILGKYWIERYSWESKKERFDSVKRKSPFGYVSLDTDEEEIEFHPFNPSKSIIEISVETSDLTLTETRERFNEILEEIKTRDDRNSLIILPEIYGDVNFIPSFVEEVFKDYFELSIEGLRSKAVFKIKTPSGKTVSAPLLTPELLLEELQKIIPKIREEIVEELQFQIDDKSLRKILNGIFEDQVLEKMPLRTTTRIENLLGEIFSRMKNVEKPEAFEDDLKSIIKRVKE